MNLTAGPVVVLVCVHRVVVQSWRNCSFTSAKDSITEGTCFFLSLQISNQEKTPNLPLWKQWQPSTHTNPDRFDLVFNLLDISNFSTAKLDAFFFNLRIKWSSPISFRNLITFYLNLRLWFLQHFFFVFVLLQQYKNRKKMRIKHKNKKK